MPIVYLSSNEDEKEEEKDQTPQEEVDDFLGNL
jgi:hypothetical protein